MVFYWWVKIDLVKELRSADKDLKGLREAVDTVRLHTTKSLDDL